MGIRYEPLSEPPVIKIVIVIMIMIIIRIMSTITMTITIMINIMIMILKMIINVCIIYDFCFFGSLARPLQIKVLFMIGRSTIRANAN